MKFWPSSGAINLQTGNHPRGTLLLIHSPKKRLDASDLQKAHPSQGSKRSLSISNVRTQPYLCPAPIPMRCCVHEISNGIAPRSGFVFAAVHESVVGARLK
jgi:hypothetical protein